jgi:hypothetical protein
MPALLQGDRRMEFSEVTVKAHRVSVGLLSGAIARCDIALPNPPRNSDLESVLPALQARVTAPKNARARMSPKTRNARNRKDSGRCPSRERGYTWFRAHR